MESEEIEEVEMKQVIDFDDAKTASKWLAHTGCKNIKITPIGLRDIEGSGYIGYAIEFEEA